MRIVVGTRAAGKTTWLADWAKGDPARVVIISTKQEGDTLRGYGVRPNQIFTVDAVRQGRARGRITPDTEVGVDNLERLLSGFLQCRVHVATVDGAVELEAVPF